VIPGHGPVFKYTPEILAIARLKLDGFVKDPVKLARHGAKVLLKFKLLEKQIMTLNALQEWALDTRCLVQYQKQYFADADFPSWLEQLCSELVKAGVAKRSADSLYNL
jgi:hypothetical protein